jgi:hypothetical protein
VKYLWSLPALGVFLAYGILTIPLIIFGALLIAVYAWHEAYAVRASEQYPGRSVLAFTPTVMWLWGNEQNGIDGATGDLPSGWPRTDWSKFRQIFVWSATRNMVGNSRWTQLFGMAVDPALVRVCYSSTPKPDLKTGVYLVHQGWRFQFRWTYSSSRQLRLGWGIVEQSGKTGLGVGFSFEPWATA